MHLKVTFIRLLIPSYPGLLGCELHLCHRQNNDVDIESERETISSTWIKWIFNSLENPLLPH